MVNWGQYQGDVMVGELAKGLSEGSDAAMKGGDFLGLGPISTGGMQLIGMGTAALAGLNKEHLLDPAQSNELMTRSQCLWSFARRVYTSDPPGGQPLEDQQAAYTKEEEPMNEICWERTPHASQTDKTPMGSRAIFLRGQLRDLVTGAQEAVGEDTLVVAFRWRSRVSTLGMFERSQQLLIFLKCTAEGIPDLECSADLLPDGLAPPGASTAFGAPKKKKKWVKDLLRGFTAAVEE